MKLPGIKKMLKSVKLKSSDICCRQLTVPARSKAAFFTEFGFPRTNGKFSIGL